MLKLHENKLPVSKGTGLKRMENTLRQTRHQITATKRSDTSSLEVSETDGLTSSQYFTQTQKKRRKSVEKKESFSICSSYV